MIDRIITFFIKNKILISFFFLIATSVLLYFTLVPSNLLGDSNLYDYDKLGHFALFFGWTLIFGLFLFSIKNTETNLIIIFMIAVAFGIIVEMLQGIMPFNRNPDFYDIIANIAGSLTATGFLFIIKKNNFPTNLNEISKKMN